MEYYTSKEVQKLLHINAVTLCRWRKESKISFVQLGKRKVLYDKQSINDLLNIQNKKQEENIKKEVIYCRVSTQSQKSELQKQKQLLLDFCNAKGIIIDECFSEIDSGMNEDRIEFNKLLNLVMQNKVKNVYITYKDRLTRFGFKYFQNIFNYYGCNIIVLNNKIDENSFENELTQDLISIINHYSMKLYSNRRKQYKEAQLALSKD